MEDSFNEMSAPERIISMSNQGTFYKSKSNLPSEEVNPLVQEMEMVIIGLKNP